MQIEQTIKMPTPETEYDRQLEVVLMDYTRKLAQLLNGGLKLSENFNQATVQVSDSGSADTEFTVTHNLKRTPSGFLVINIDKGGVVYDSGTAWTSTAMYLKCSAANAALTVIVF